MIVDNYAGICEVDECCGCGVCTQICPKSCLKMQEDKVEKFLYPSIDLDKCIHCGICQKTCPVLQAKAKKETGTTCYVGYCLDGEQRTNSSSGAIFPVLAKQMLNYKGYVYGAIFNDDVSRVLHIGTDELSVVRKMFGSKYIQSNLSDIYKDVKAQLEIGKRVLFSGTACQVNALNSFLGKDYKNLITVDVVCHGVSSPRILEVIKIDIEQRKKKKIKSINFRNKDVGWKKFFFKIIFNDDSEYKTIFPHSEFGELFVNNLSLRENCYNCKFKDGNHGSDITIGDAWGIEKFAPEMFMDNGVSVIIIHTEKGKKLINDISKNVKIKEVDLRTALNDNVFYFKSVSKHSKRDKYLELLEKDNPDLKAILSLVHISFVGKVVRKIRIICNKGKNSK